MKGFILKVFVCFLNFSLGMLNKMVAMYNNKNGKDNNGEFLNFIISNMFAYINSMNYGIYKYTKIMENKLNLNNTRKYQDFSIVMQGSLNGNVTFLKESIKFYTENYPGIFLVISTWEDEIQKDIIAIQEFIKMYAGVELLLNKKPQYNGKRKCKLPNYFGFKRNIQM